MLLLMLRDGLSFVEGVSGHKFQCFGHSVDGINVCHYLNILKCKHFLLGITADCLFKEATIKVSL